jgi:hypothetical protein
LPRRVRADLKRIIVASDDDGNFTVHWNGKTYWVPHWDYHSGCASVSGFRAGASASVPCPVALVEYNKAIRGRRLRSTIFPVRAKRQSFAISAVNLFTPAQRKPDAATDAL